MARQPLGVLGRLIYRGFTITILRHTTLGRTPLDEGPARRRDLYLITQHSQETDSHDPGGIRTHNPSKRGPQTHALDRAGTGIGIYSLRYANNYCLKIKIYF
jgi:hypothetical protein